MKIWTRPKKTTAKSNSNSSMASRMSSLVPNGTAWANYVISDTLVEKIPIRILICHGWNPYSCNWNSKNLSKTLIRSSINIDMNFCAQIFYWKMIGCGLGCCLHWFLARRDCPQCKSVIGRQTWILKYINRIFFHQ